MSTEARANPVTCQTGWARFQFVLVIWVIVSSNAFGITPDHHDSAIYHAITLEADSGYARDGANTAWDLDGWIGEDYNKLWLKSVGEISAGSPEQVESWIMYSRNISEFWDAQFGVRVDSKPSQVNYLTLGFTGLAPYFFVTEAHIFISDKGDLSGRIRQENDLHLTQALVAQPYLEADLFAQDTPEYGVGAGLATIELGLQTRYEFTRRFGPYIDLRYQQDCGQTSSIARRAGRTNNDFITSVGFRIIF